MRAQDLPAYRDMPAVKDMPHGTAWGLFDKDGTRDQVGTLNLLTPEVVMEAQSEIKTGKSISLDLPLNFIKTPSFGRSLTTHKIISLESAGFYVHDDEVAFNTQASSQWDGFKHFAHQQSKLFYNGQSMAEADLTETEDNGIQHWLERGGIVGRGVLLDFARYAKKHGIEYDVTSDYQITLDVLKDVAKDQGVIFKPGDILMIRTGFGEWYQNASAEQRATAIGGFPSNIGLKASPETIEWLWDSHFAAIASDNIAVEAMPFPQPWDTSLHVNCIALWGMPLGEWFDLEKLAAECAAQQRHSFFLTSAVLNIPGGVASPPNALAVF